MATIDVAIMTGLLEEFVVLKRLLPPMEDLVDGSDIWYRTRVQGAGGANYEIVAAYQDRMGPLGAP